MVFPMAGGPWLFGHRGAPTQAPENSLESFRLAVAGGADVLEIDVRVTRDGHPVVFHDADGARCARRPVVLRHCTLAEVQTWDISTGQGQVSTRPPVPVPTLSQALEAFPNTPFNVDIKDSDPAAADAVVRVVASHGAAQRVLLTSFALRPLRRARRDHRGPTGLSQVEAMRALLWPMEAGHGALAGQRLQIPLAYAGLSLGRRDRIERAHRQGLWVDYWVINDPQTARVLLDRGADGIVTDEPARLSAVFRQHPRCRRYRERHA